MGKMDCFKFVLVFLSSVSFSMTLSAQDEANALNGRTVIYYNLGLGDITMTPSKVTGYRWNGSSWVYESNGDALTNGSYYHIIVDPGRQFNGNPTTFNSSYQQAVTTTNGGSVNIVNQTDAANVLSAWNSRATTLKNQGKRKSTSYKITVSCNIGYYILLDNVWSEYQSSGGSRKTGGLAFLPQKESAKLRVYLKGDNRLGNVFYSSTKSDGSSSTDFTNTKIVFYSATSGNSGTLTVGNIDPSGSKNYFDSVIGGSDDEDCENSRGIVIAGGTIFAGAVFADNCTAIGAGGNGIGQVTITGGIVTAVTSSTGTAIGGGIGWNSAGGEGNVTISGGTVYAYNHGYVDGTKFVPAAAVGGASSFVKAGAAGTVTISGGTVYAQSTGGVAIGGGGSHSSNGGSATVTINGGSITAKSVSGSQGGVSIGYGSAIGGGVGGGGNGGNCSFTMSAGTLQAGSVGGGSTNKSGSRVGAATVNITGGDIRAQFIMAGGGTSACRFTMSGGTIHNSSTTGNANFKLVKEDGGALWQGDPSGVVSITGGTIDNCDATNGGAIYTTGGSVTVSNATISNCSASGDGGAFYLSPGATISMSSGSIVSNSARNGGGVYLSAGATLNYSTTSSSTGYIRDNTASNLGGGVYLAQGSSSSMTRLNFTLNSPNLGFYDNTAGVGADDIYAYGEGTTQVTIPSVSTMNLGGYSVAGATLEWFEDYKVGDNRYSYGTQQGDASAIRRYRAARDASLPVWKVPAQSTTALSTFYEKYLCLTLGFEYGSIVIRRSGLLPRQNAIYKIEFQGSGTLNRPTQYVTVLGTAEEDKTLIGGVRWNVSSIGYLPKGTYTVTELPWTWYKTDKTAGATVKTQDISTDAGKIYEFSNTGESVKTLPRHDEESKVNELNP